MSAMASGAGGHGGSRMYGFAKFSSLLLVREFNVCVLNARGARSRENQ